MRARIHTASSARVPLQLAPNACVRACGSQCFVGVCGARARSMVGPQRRAPRCSLLIFPEGTDLHADAQKKDAVYSEKLGLAVRCPLHTATHSLGPFPLPRRCLGAAQCT